MDLTKIKREYLHWMNLTQNSDQWQALLNTVMNIQVQ